MRFTTSRSRFPQSSHSRPTFVNRMTPVSATSLNISVPINYQITRRRKLLNKLFLKRLGEAYPWKATLQAKDSMYKCTSLSTFFTPRRPISPPGRFLPCFLSTPINLEIPPTEKKTTTNDTYSKASRANQLIQPGRSAFIKDRWMCGLILEKTSQASCWHDEVFWHLGFIICNVQPFHVQKENTSFLKSVEWGKKGSLKGQILSTYHRLSKQTFQRKSSFPELKEIPAANSADKVYLHHPFINLYYFF